MTELKFVGELPPRKSAPLSLLLTALRARPGEWAEVARYDESRRVSAASRGSNTIARHPDIEAATRSVDGEVVLYMRAKPGDGQAQS